MKSNQISSSSQNTDGVAFCLTNVHKYTNENKQNKITYRISAGSILFRAY